MIAFYRAKDKVGSNKKCDHSSGRFICTCSSSRKYFSIAKLLLLAFALSDVLGMADAFFSQKFPRHTIIRTSTRLNDYKDFRESAGHSDGESGEEIWGGDGDLDAPSEAIDDLSWRVARLRLEEENTRRFLKAGPRFLPYEECRKWVAAWNRWDTEADWKNWIREGEKRNAYIPARPDEYYGKLGKWISWDHFLGKETVNEADGGKEGDEDYPNKCDK